MFRRLLAAEARLLLRDPAALIGAVVLLACTALASGLGAARVDAEQAAIHSVQAELSTKQAALRQDAARVQAHSPAAAHAPRHGHGPPAAAGHGPAGHRPAGHGPAGHEPAGHRPTGHGPPAPAGGMHGPNAPPPGSSAGTVGLSALPGAAILTPSPLAALATGISDVQPAIQRVTARPRHTFAAAYELESPLGMAAGAFDAAFVFLFLLPMVILAANYNLLSADRDSGVMAMALAQPGGAGAYVRARLAVRAGAVGALVVAAWAVALLAGRVDLAAPGAMGAAFLLLAVLGLYAAFWTTLALVVNLAVRASAACGVVLAGLWLLLVVITPALVALIAGSAIPAPSRLLLSAEIRQAAHAADRERARTLEAFYMDHPDMAAAAPTAAGQTGGGDAFSMGILASDAAVERAVRPSLDAFDSALARRQALVEGLQILSPTLAAQIAIEDLTGRGARRYAAFAAAAHRFHDRWSRFFVTRILGSGRMTSADYGRLPRWRMDEPQGWPLSRLNTLALAATALLVLAGLGASAALARRMKP